MTSEQKNRQAIDVLKIFNQAVTTSRLYPAVSPQVSLAVEKAYKETKKFTRQYRELSFGQNGSDILLCGEAAQEKCKQELHDLVIFRHLALLAVDYVVLRPGFDRTIFNKILSVFIARKEKINREGGGRFFVNGLGLEQFFPETYEPLDQPGEPDIEIAGGKLEGKIGTASEAELDLLYGDIDGQEVDSAIKNLFANTETSSDLIIAGIARTLDHLSRRESRDVLVVSSSYSRFLENVSGLLASQDQETVARTVATKIIEYVDEHQLGDLLVQNYPEGFGLLLSSMLLGMAPNDKFDHIIGWLRNVGALFAKQGQGNSPQSILVSEATEKLLNSVKGKQFLGREKAQSMLQSGEQERQSKRLETGISSLIQGNTDSLQSDEIVFSLPNSVNRFIADNQLDDALRIIEKVAGEMIGGDDMLRKRLIQCLILIAEKLIDDKRWDWLEKMTGALISWIRESDDGDFIYEKTVSILQMIMDHAWENGNYSRGDQILSVVYKIRSGQLQKSAPVLALTGRIQDRSFNRQQIETFLKLYLGDKGDGQFGRRLSMLGRPAGNYLIDVLLKNEDTAERLKIVEVLANMGPVAIPVLSARLKEPMPWYGKRNLIKLIAEVAGPEQVEVVIPFLKHEDIRVQREAFVCIYIISGERRRDALIKCLGESSEAMYPQIVKALLPYSDKEIVDHLKVLLEDQEHFSVNIREPLVLEILKVLARSNAKAGRGAIRTFIENKSSKANRKLKDNVWASAESSLKQLEESLSGDDFSAVVPKAAENMPLVEKGLQPVRGEKKKPAVKPAPVKDYSMLPGAAKVSELIDSGEIGQARELLVDLVSKMARKRRFDAAEKIRGWLMDVDPMALTEIIRAAEIIEEEKMASVDSDHVETWAELYDVLSTEEFATLYHAMERKTFENEEIIVKQGSMQSGLYFISNGKVKVFFKDKRGEVLVKVASKGEILGSETVFDASVWTISAASMSKTDIMILRTGKLKKWREDYPSLESKLSDFCLKSESLKQFFKVSGKDRRQAKRYKIAGRVSNVLLDDKGQDTGITSKGDLFDISAGGVSFFLRISQKKNAKLLLGRGIKVSIPTESTPSRQIAVVGTMIAVRGHQAMENEYSVHVRFNDDLAGSEVQAIIKASNPNT